MTFVFVAFYGGGEESAYFNTRQRNGLEIHFTEIKQSNLANINQILVRRANIADSIFDTQKSTKRGFVTCTKNNEPSSYPQVEIGACSGIS